MNVNGKCPEQRGVPALRHHLAFLKTLPGELTGVAHAVADIGAAICRRYLSAAPHSGDVSLAGDMREDAGAMAESPFRWPRDRQRGRGRNRRERSTISRNPRRRRICGSARCCACENPCCWISSLRKAPGLIHPAGSQAKSCRRVYAERILLRLTTSSRACFLLLTLTPCDGRSIGCRERTHRDIVSRRRVRRRWRVRRRGLHLAVLLWTAGFLQAGTVRASLAG